MPKKKDTEYIFINRHAFLKVPVQLTSAYSIEHIQMQKKGNPVTGPGGPMG
jgi:hypothetical protein